MMFSILMIIMIFLLFSLSIAGGGYLGTLMFPGLAFEAGAIATVLLLAVLISALFLTGTVSIQRINADELMEAIKEEDEDKED
jgi:hypothetical protein